MSATASRLRTAVLASTRAFARDPFHLAVLLVLPPAVVVGYGEAMAAFPQLPGLSAPPRALGRISGATFAAAFLAGLVGLFQVISARRADGRLGLAGFPRTHLLAGRFATVALVALVGASVSLASVWYDTAPERPALALAALALAGLTYGALGVLVGALLPRELEGSLVLVFVADIDAAMATGIVGELDGIAWVFPLSHVHTLVETAVLGGDVALADAAGAVGYALVLAAAATLAYARLTRGGAA
ncbi:hypothetical protein [Haloarchaeobius iranensis]|uniref:ABC-2 type transport system permease protein n=1 Tax=Haloarchaeobius iranensis TaxID=996166 RepID=A0A1H0A0P1_9EURY|nr:hypothetical protein [Haloarchaeobius iranensis]SDN26276.1 hypothetical protein SAMN05192554_12342 [Haloarchaeobius iranensis]